MKMRYKIIGIQMIFIILVVGIYFFLNSPIALYPLNGMVIDNPNFNFEMANGKEIILSNSYNFENPINLDKSSKITLPPGVYFWKVRGILRESEIKNFTIKSLIQLELNEKSLINSGNVILKIREKNNSGESSFDLGIKEEINISENNSVYEGGQK